MYWGGAMPPGISATARKMSWSLMSSRLPVIASSTLSCCAVTHTQYLTRCSSKLVDVTSAGTATWLNWLRSYQTCE